MMMPRAAGGVSSTSCLTALRPVDDVVRVAPFRWAITAGKAAMPVSQHQCRPQRGRDGPCRPAEVKVGRGPSGHHAVHAGVTEDAADGGGVEVWPVDHPADAHVSAPSAVKPSAASKAPTAWLTLASRRSGRANTSARAQAAQADCPIEVVPSPLVASAGTAVSGYRGLPSCCEQRPATARWRRAQASRRPTQGPGRQRDGARRLEGHHASGAQRVHLLDRGCQAGSHPGTPHPTDHGGARGRSAPALLLARAQAPRADRPIAVGAGDRQEAT